jgi:hypothetical protein
MQEEAMDKHSMFAVVLVGAMTLGAVVARADKSWCTDAHMQKMDEMVAKMTDEEMKKSAAAHLDQSKAAMKSGDMDGCIAHMKMAHKDMGM